MAAATFTMPSRNDLFHPALQTHESLRVGGIVFGYGDVHAYDVYSSIERDWYGQWMCAFGYGIASALLLIAILLGADWKFAIAVVFLGAISLMSIGDALGVMRVTIHHLDMTLHDGREVAFIDGDVRVVQALVQRIEAARTTWG